MWASLGWDGAAGGVTKSHISWLIPISPYAAATCVHRVESGQSARLGRDAVIAGSGAGQGCAVLAVFDDVTHSTADCLARRQLAAH